MNKMQRVCAAATGLIAAVLITPYCGALFECGCTWPWAGLAARCNFHVGGTGPVCPWCEHQVIGAIAALSAVIVGAWGASLRWAPSEALRLGPATELFARTLMGVGWFSVAVLVWAAFTALAVGPTP